MVRHSRHLRTQPTDSNIDSKSFTITRQTHHPFNGCPWEYEYHSCLSYLCHKHGALVPSLCHQPRVHHSIPNCCSSASGSTTAPSLSSLSQPPLLLGGTKPVQRERPHYPPYPTRVPGIFRAERAQSIIATPGIKQAPFVHAQNLQQDTQLWWRRSVRCQTYSIS